MFRGLCFIICSYGWIEFIIKLNGIGFVEEIIILLVYFYFVILVFFKEIYKYNLGLKKFYKVVKSVLKN